MKTQTQTITFDMKWKPFVRPLVDVAKGASEPKARENAIQELEGMARVADLAGEWLDVLKAIQSECEDSPDGLHEATLGVIAMKARQAIAAAKGGAK